MAICTKQQDKFPANFQGLLQGRGGGTKNNQNCQTRIFERSRNWDGFWKIVGHVEILNLVISKIEATTSRRCLPAEASTQGNAYINTSVLISALLFIKCHQHLGFFPLIPSLFSFLAFSFTLHFYTHWMILLFMSKELFKGNRALVSFIANLIMFCIPSKDDSWHINSESTIREREHAKAASPSLLKWPQ